MSDAMEARRQDMGEVSPDEFDCAERHHAIAGFRLTVAGGSSVSEGHRVAVEVEDAA